MNRTIALVSLVTAVAFVACGGTENRLGGNKPLASGGAAGDSDSGTGGMAVDSGTGGVAVGSNTGGSNTGGSNTGASNTGASNTGGMAVGSNTGGSNTGGMAIGSNTGGSNTGGMAVESNTGGSNTGGMAVATNEPPPQKPAFPAEFGDPTAAHTYAAGKWKGYIENLSTTGSDAILLELDTLSDTSVVGKVVFGNASVPAPDFSDPETHFMTFEFAADESLPSEGYPFTVISGSFDGLRLRFEVIRMEIWQGWCAQQAPIDNTAQPGTYMCSPNGGFSEDNGCAPVGCGRASLCMRQRICICNATECFISEATALHFDIAMRGDQMDGSVAGLPDGSTHNVHLTKL